jgi:hypothetical protein
MVEPRFRGHRLFERMIALARQRAAEKGMLGLYAEAVTVHPFSQKGNIALGATETGVQLGDEPPVTMKRIDDGASRKRTATILHYFKTGDGPARDVYAPPHHRTMIERIYRHGGLPRTLEPAPALLPEPPATSAVRVELYPKWSEAAIRVAACGRDLPELVRFRLRELCLRHVAWIGLDLPLSDPALPSLCAPLEALGFFFAGVVRELADGDVLRLQYPDEVDVEVRPRISPLTSAATCSAMSWRRCRGNWIPGRAAMSAPSVFAQNIQVSGLRSQYPGRPRDRWYCVSHSRFTTSGSYTGAFRMDARSTLTPTTESSQFTSVIHSGEITT